SEPSGFRIRLLVSGLSNADYSLPRIIALRTWRKRSSIAFADPLKSGRGKSLEEFAQSGLFRRRQPFGGSGLRRKPKGRRTQRGVKRPVEPGGREHSLGGQVKCLGQQGDHFPRVRHPKATPQITERCFRDVGQLYQLLDGIPLLAPGKIDQFPERN